MIYTSDITIPANTPSTAPKEARMKISLGLIYKVELQFPPGCGGLAHIVINDGGYQIWPSTPGADFATDDYTISFEDTYLKTADPSEIVVYGYNKDETYPHTIQIRLGCASKDIFMARYMPTLTYDYFIEMLAKKSAEDEEKRNQPVIQPFAFLSPRVT